MRLLAAVTLLALPSCAGKGSASSSAGKVLAGVHHYGQKMENWCWAASGQMIMEYKDYPIEQKQQAADEFQMPECLNDTVPDSCDLAGWPQFEDYGFAYWTTSNSTLTWDEVKREIDSDRPFAFSDPDGVHVMVAIGYVDRGYERDVYYNEPLHFGDAYSMTYEDYAGTNGRHWVDFYHIERRADDVEKP